MFNRSTSNLTKIISTTCVIALTTVAAHSYTTSSISRYTIENRVKTLASRYLQDHGHYVYQIPRKIKPEYDLKIGEITDALKRTVDRTYQTTLYDYEVSDTVNPVMDLFITKTLKTIVRRLDMRHHADRHIENYAASQGITINSIPTRDRSDFRRRKNNVERNLNNIMRRDNRDYVRTYEVEQETKRELEAFFNRIERPRDNSTFNWMDYLFGGGNSTTSSSSSTTTNNRQRIYRDELNRDLVEDTIKQLLRREGIDPDALPSRVNTEHNNAIRNTLNEMRRRINRSRSNYVRRSEVERVADREIKPLLETLRFEKQNCSICQDGYERTQRIGMLNCGHPFHEKCIKTWLDYQKTCPLCRANGVFVSKIEHRQ